jgi:archaellum component FlaC
MSIPDQLRNIRDNLRSGRFGQREVWERQLEEAAAAIERQWGYIETLKTSQSSAVVNELRDEVERLTKTVADKEKLLQIVCDEIDRLKSMCTP